MRNLTIYGSSINVLKKHSQNSTEMVKTLLLIYILSTFVVMWLRHFSKNGHEFKRYDEKDWAWYIFFPIFNTICALIVILLLFRSFFTYYVLEHFFSTWQLLPTIQLRKDPDLIFLMIALPIYGSLIYSCERKVKGTD